MPNYVRNIVSFEGDSAEIKKMLYKVKDGERLGTIDFNKIIPMPEELNIECSNRTNDGLKLVNEYMEANKSKAPDILTEYRWLKEHCEEVSALTWVLGMRAYLNKKKYGYEDWYGWRIKNWGTKWNAFDNEGSSDNFCFDTAWSAPHPVMLALSKMFPGIEFKHLWADEDIGNNCGYRVYKDGEIVREYIPDYCVKSIDFACNLWGRDPEDYGLVLDENGTNYVCQEGQG